MPKYGPVKPKAEKSLVGWILLILAVVVAYELILGARLKDVARPSFSDFMQEVERTPEHIKSVRIDGQEYHITYNEAPPQDKLKILGPSQSAQGEVLAALNRAKIRYEFERNEGGPGWIELLLASGMPMLIGLIFFLVVMRQVRPRREGAPEPPRIPAPPKLTLADVAGLESLRPQLDELVAFLKDSKRLTQLGGRFPRGILFSGAPGTGKTLLVQAIAGEAGVPLFVLSGKNFVEMFVGIGPSRVRDLFEQGRRNAPCILFLDDVEAIAQKTAPQVASEERIETRNQLLAELEGLQSEEGVLFFAATNQPELLDPLLFQPGHLDRSIQLPLPDARGRLEILKLHARSVTVDPNLDLTVVADGTDGFSGADLAALVNEAALLGARRTAAHIEFVDFEAARAALRRAGPKSATAKGPESEAVAALPPPAPAG